MLSNRGNGWGLAVLRLQPTARVSRASESSAHVLTQPYIGVLWEVACDNILRYEFLSSLFSQVISCFVVRERLFITGRRVGEF